MANMSATKDEIRNFQIRQTYVEEKVTEVRDQYDYDTEGEAFQALAVSLLFDTSYDSIDPAEIVDGGQDKQIDIIRIEDDQNGSAHVHIIQAKKVNGFGSNVLIKMSNGLGWLFEQRRADYSALANRPLVNKIDEIRQLRTAYGATNLTVSVYFVTLGDTRILSDEFLQERSNLLSKYQNAGFNEFTFREIGALELVELLDETERLEREIDVEIPVVYDMNVGSQISYHSGDTMALICTVKGVDLAEAASTEPRDAIFDLNVRPFYGSRGKVNHDIRETCISSESSRFWFLNNGITMTCDSFNFVPDPDHAHVKIKNAQIVNGCQTAVTLREAWERSELKDDVNLLLRIYATDNPNLTQRITLTTNNQNQITDRDLRANDEVQRDIQRVMKENYGYNYERKNKQYRATIAKKTGQIVPNVKAAQAYLAAVRRKPSVARGYLGKIWSEYYEEIFGNVSVADLLAAFLIYDYCSIEARKARKDDEMDPLEEEVAVYGVFHLTRICGFLLTEDNWGSKNQASVDQLIHNIKQDASILEKVYERAKKILIDVRKETVEDDPSPTLYFKASEIQRDIAKTLADLGTENDS